MLAILALAKNSISFRGASVPLVSAGVTICD